MKCPDLNLGRRHVLGERQQNGDGGVEVLRRAHAADVAVKAAESQRVAGARHNIPEVILSLLTTETG